MPYTRTNEIFFTDLPGYTENFSVDRQEAVRPVAVEWTEQKAFKEAVLGWSFKFGTRIRRSLPEPHPIYPWLFVTDCDLSECVGFMRDDGPNQFPTFHYTSGDNGDARFRLTYRALDYPVLDDAVIDALPTGELSRYVTVQTTYGIEAIPLGPNTFKWTVAPLDQIPAPGVRQFAKDNYLFTWHSVPTPPTDRIFAARGKVNSAPFHIFPEGGTVLFSGYQVMRKFDVRGFITWEVTYQFSWRPQGWNKLPRPSTNNFVEVSTTGVPFPEPAPDRVHPYDSYDFNQLFGYTS